MSEYTITVTVREIEGSTTIEQRAVLDDSGSTASAMARTLNEIIAMHVGCANERLIELGAQSATDKTFH